MHAGQRRYAVRWKDGTPYIASGRLVRVGTKRVQFRVEMPESEKPLAIGHSSADMWQAILWEVEHLAQVFCSPFTWKKSRNKPEALAWCVAKLCRLRRRLERHHLI